MCYRFVPLTHEEIESALARRRLGERAVVDAREGRQGGARDAFPGADVPVILPDGAGRSGGAPQDSPALRAAVLTWGFWASWEQGHRSAQAGAQTSARAGAGGREDASAAEKPGGRLVFNTRLDTALNQLARGRGMWSDAIAHGRCLVPARAFYERSATESVLNPQTGKLVKQTYRFVLANASIFLLAGIARDGRFSIVTTEPNGTVARVHNRMPLVLAPGESAAWLAGDFGRFADRSAVRLLALPEDPAALNAGDSLHE